MRAEEADDISRIYAESWKTAYKGIVPEGYLEELPHNRWTSMLMENPEKSFVLLDNVFYIGSIDKPRQG
jgi:hypothetical protein